MIRLLKAEVLLCLSHAEILMCSQVKRMATPPWHHHMVVEEETLAIIQTRPEAADLLIALNNMESMLSGQIQDKVGLQNGSVQSSQKETLRQLEFCNKFKES